MKLKEAFNEWAAEVGDARAENVSSHSTFSARKHLEAEQATLEAYSYSYDKFLAAYHYVGKEWGIEVLRDRCPKAEKWHFKDIMLVIEQRNGKRLTHTVMCDVPESIRKAKAGRKERELVGWLTLERLPEDKTRSYGHALYLYALSRGASQPARVDVSSISMYGSNADNRDKNIKEALDKLKAGETRWNWAIGDKGVVVDALTAGLGSIKVSASDIGSQSFGGNRRSHYREERHDYIVEVLRAPPPDWVATLQTHVVSKALVSKP